jgi:carbamoyltransferase
MEYFNYCTGLTMTNGKFETLFGGPARRPETLLTQRDMDLGRSVQEVTEEVMLRLARTLHRETGAENLCLADGVALNSVGNDRILREGPFKGVRIQPAAGDSGGALGAALTAWHRLEDKPRHVNGKTRCAAVFWGPSFTNEEIAEFLKSKDAPHAYLSDEVLLVEWRLIWRPEKSSAGFKAGWSSDRGPWAAGASSGMP